MSRIRSIHPGLWTDEEFVTLSAFARLLFMGLWTECDDKGIFEWKPLTIKMRLLPADNLDVSELLDELLRAVRICKFEVDGRQFGAVRNFGKFQRPKKPNDIHPSTPEILEFCAIGSEPKQAQGAPVPNQFPTGGENPSQMEDGGWRMEDGEGKEETKYKFEGRVVRLNERDHARWAKMYFAVADLNAEIATLDAWLSDQPEAKRAKWYATGTAWMNRRHQEAMAARSPARDAEFSGPC